MAKGGGKSGGSGGGSSKPSGGGSSGGSKPSGGGSSGGSKPSGGGQSSGGSKPSGGGGQPSSGGSKPSGGGNKPQGGGQTKSVATPTVSVTAKSNKTPTPTFIPTNKPSGGSGSSGSQKQDRVQTLTKKANELIASASGGAIADPGKFKEVLSKLKKLGKDERVDVLREKKQKAVAASRPKEAEPVTNLNNEITSNNNYPNVFEPLPTTFTPGFGDSQGGYSSSASSFSSGPSWDETYSQDLNKWLEQYQTEQAGRATDYQSMLTDLASQEGQFDPNLFRSLLGELESSKKRQKEWNERSARAAYKY